MFNLFVSRRGSQDERLLKLLMANEGKEVNVSKIVLGLKIFHYTEVIRRLRKKGKIDGFEITNRFVRKADKNGNFRSFYKLTKTEGKRQDCFSYINGL